MKSKMEITLIKQIPQIVTVEVELPYYFEHDLSDDYGESIIYGKIEEKLYTTIHESKRYDGLVTYEIEKEEHKYIKTIYGVGYHLTLMMSISQPKRNLRQLNSVV